MSSFKDNLRYMREQAGYKQAKDFSIAVGIPYTRYMAYENKGSWPSENNLCKIADALNCAVDGLLGRENHASYYELRCMHLENKLKNIASIASDV